LDKNVEAIITAGILDCGERNQNSISFKVSRLLLNALLVTSDSFREIDELELDSIKYRLLHA
jgi:hypothetical protein